MALHRFGYDNLLLRGALSASAETAALPATNLLTVGGAPSEALQTPAGTTALTLTLEMPAAESWREFCLARTNLTPAATVRWRIGENEAQLAEPVTQSADTNDGAGKGGNTTRVGSYTMSDGTPATSYTNSSTASAFVSRSFVLGVGRYRVSAKVQRVSGSGTTGRIISASYRDAAGTSMRANLPMTALPPSGAVTLSIDIDNRSAGSSTMYLFTDTGPVGEVALSGITVTPLAPVDILCAGPVPRFRQVVACAPAAVTGRLLRCEISDPTNPDGFLNIPLAWVGRCWEVAIGLSPQSAPEPERRGILREFRSGGLRRQPIFFRRGWSLQHVGTLPAEVWSQLDPLEAAAHEGGNVLFIPDADSPDLQREAILGLMQFQGGWTFPYSTGERRGWRARIDERL